MVTTELDAWMTTMIHLARSPTFYPAFIAISSVLSLVAWTSYWVGRRRGRLEQSIIDQQNSNDKNDTNEFDENRPIVSNGNTVYQNNVSPGNGDEWSKATTATVIEKQRNGREVIAENRHDNVIPTAPFQSQVSHDSLPVHPIATLESIYRLCVGTPRQGMLAPHSRGIITFDETKVSKDSVLELQNFSHVFVVFVFHLNSNDRVWEKTFGNGVLSKQDVENENDVKFPRRGSKCTNRKTKTGQRQFPSKIAPPSLGGQKVGIFSTRTPHRPNPIGFSLCKLDKVIVSKNANRKQKTSTFSLLLSGLDIVDGTPILDIKPYVPHYDCVGFSSDHNLHQTNGEFIAGHLNAEERHNSVDPQIEPQAMPVASGNSYISKQTVKVPHWVDSGLQKRRNVTFLPEADNFFRELAVSLDDMSSNENKTTKSSPFLCFNQKTPKLQFYGPDSQWNDDPTTAVHYLKSCIHEVLGVDVRSAWQTKKARKGKFQAERSRRVSEWKGIQKHTDSEKESNTVFRGMCSQQIDNLIIHFTIDEPCENHPDKSTGEGRKAPAVNECSHGSGAEDVVLVHSISMVTGST